MKAEVDPKPLAYALRAVRKWIYELEKELAEASDSEDKCDDQDFLLQLTLAQDDLMEAYASVYDPNSNMIEPSRLDIKRE